MAKNGVYNHIGPEIITFIPYLLVIPLSVYGTLRLYTKHRSSMFAVKRKLFILFGLNISFLFGILAAMNIHIGKYYTGSIEGVGGTIYLTSFWAVLFFLITKNWLIYFDYKWQYYSLQLKWQQLINKKILDTQQSDGKWYLRNKNRWGKLSFFAKRYGCFVLFACICQAINAFSDTKLQIVFFMLNILSIFSVTLFYIFIICKTPFYKDIFYIHYESKLHAKVLLILVVSVIIMLVIILAVNEESVGLKDGLFAGITHPLTATMFGIMIYISTFVIWKKNSMNTKVLIQFKEKKKFIPFTEMEKFTVELILSHEKGVNLFMNHLAKEYSMESLLAFIEFCQYQKYIIENDTENVIETTTKNCIQLIDFPSNIPLSEIIECQEENDNNFHLYEYKVKAHKIFQKYVENDAGFEINIPSVFRTDVSQLLSNLNMFLAINVTFNDLVLLFEDCKKEMRILLVYSLQRFKTSDEFEQIIQVFAEDDENKIDSTHHTAIVI